LNYQVCDTIRALKKKESDYERLRAMSKRNKPGRQLSPMELVRSLMGDIGSDRHLGSGPIDLPPLKGLSGLTGLINDAINPFGRTPKKSSRREEWLAVFNVIPAMYPKSSHGYRFHSVPSFEIKDVFADGTIVGVAKTTSGPHYVFVRTKFTDVPAGCSCVNSHGTAPCEHSFYFAAYVVKLVSNAGSSLSAKIENGTFTPGKPDMSLFEFDASKEVLSRLDSLIDGRSERELSYDELAPLAVQEPSRVAWNVEILHDMLRLDLLLQSPKKKGGFTKGKRSKIGSIYQTGLMLSPADKCVRSLIKSSADYYNAGLSIDLGEALSELVGEPNVHLDGEPATVERGTATLCLVKTAEGYQFQFESRNGYKSVMDGNSLIAVSPELRKIVISKSTRSQNELISNLVRLPRIANKHEQVILERARKLQSTISLKLPEEVAGPFVSETTTPTLILRSRKDGALDYGIRVRDSKSRILKPAEGIMIRSENTDGKPTQRVRCATSEANLVADLTRRLNLQSNQLDGTIQDFSTALDVIEVLQTSGSDIEVLWDKSSEQPLKVLGTVSASNVRVGISQKRDWFNLTGECDFGDHSLDIATLMQGLRDASETSVMGEFVKVGDAGWARISEKLRKSLRQLDDSVNQERGALRFDKTSAHALRSLQGQIQVDGTKAWNECLLRLDRSEKLEPTLPVGLKATLRDYQLDGFKWLRRLAEWGVGGVLADDMGLGKTIQTLAVILDRAAEGPTLVIAPTSVGFNWMREVEKFAPELSAFLYRETDRSDFLESVGPNEIVVCSYGLALRDAEHLAKVKWGTMVLDEAQAIKNSRSKTSIAIATIPAKWTVALTGTPVENHLGELWSLFHVVSPGVLGGWDQFRNRFAVPIEKNNDDDRRKALRNRLTPFILRRTKSEVLKDLPARTEMNLYVELSPAERAVYDSVRMSAIGEADSIAKLADVSDQRFRILALLTRLRQIACHPRMVHESWTEGSAKLTQLSETLLQLREEGHRVLIFSQFVKHLALIREMMDAEGVSYQYLDGSTPAAARQTEVDKFQNGDATAFLISLKAGGTGLNLTAADYVIHMDPWWNPAVEDQATDRAHRIGQDKPVMVYRIVAQNTIEEEILKLHETKRDLVAGILDGTHTAAKLSTHDLIELLRS